MTTPTVSVIIPAYNCGHFLHEAVDSVRRQTYQDLEVIVVDDGSTDDTPEVVRELAAGWEKVRPILADHRGTPVNINRGIQQARGEWLAMLGADDLWLPEILQRCMDFLADHSRLSIVYTPMSVTKMDGSSMKGHSKACHAGWITEKLFQSIFVHDSSAVFHRRVVQTCGGLDESIPVGSGHEFWLRVSTKFEFGLIDEPLAVRRWSTTSLTRSNRPQGRVARAGMLERFYFERGGKDLIDAKGALRRLSHVHYSAGKILLKQGDYRRGQQFLAKAIRYNPANLKAYPFYIACLLCSFFQRGRTGFSEA